MRVKFETYKGALATWEDLFGQAAARATELGETRVINISHSCDGSKGVVTLWYWDD